MEKRKKKKKMKELWQRKPPKELGAALHSAHALGASTTRKINLRGAPTTTSLVYKSLVTTM